MSVHEWIAVALSTFYSSIPCPLAIVNGIILGPLLEHCLLLSRDFQVVCVSHIKPNPSHIAPDGGPGLSYLGLAADREIAGTVSPRFPEDDSVLQVAPVTIQFTDGWR